MNNNWVITIEPNVSKITIGDNIKFTITVVNQGTDLTVLKML